MFYKCNTFMSSTRSLLKRYFMSKYLLKYSPFIRFFKGISFCRFMKTMVLSEMQYFMTSCSIESETM